MKKFPKLKHPAVLAPMAGVTDVAFRVLAKKYGAGMTYTEFVNSAGLVRENRKSLELVKIGEKEKPVGVQLFGNSVDDVVEAGKLVEKRFDVIDVNCGCPAWKVVRIGAGSAMLKDVKMLERFVSRLVDSVKKPVTVKIRTGVDEKNINAVEVAKIIEGCGAAAVTVHGRTQSQGYSGEADWEIIRKVKENVDIPVIGNGDVFSPEIFFKRLEESGVDAIMIGRGAMNNPYIFKQIIDYGKKGEYYREDGVKQFFEYMEFAEKYKVGFSCVRDHAIWFTKGLKFGNKLRDRLSKCKNKDDVLRIMKSG